MGVMTSFQGAAKQPATFRLSVLSGIRPAPPPRANRIMTTAEYNARPGCRRPPFE